jgi:hypothetical protein
VSPIHTPARAASLTLRSQGGYAILKGIQKGMRLPADKMMPSFANLKDYGVRAERAG